MIGKPDCELSRQTGFCEKNAVFKKISEIHFSSDCKNFDSNEFRVPKSTDNSNLKVLARIIKKFKILTIFKNFLKNFEALNQNFATYNFLIIYIYPHSENFKALAKN